MTIIGRIINTKSQAAALVRDLFDRFDGTMESSVAISTIEDKIVRAGFLTWDEVEAAELGAVQPPEIS